MGSLPNLSAVGLQRFAIDRSTGQPVAPDGFPWKLDMRPLIPRLTLTLKNISNVAKINDDGSMERKWNYKLPPMTVAAMLIAPYHINGAAPSDQFPYSLKAIGLVDPNKILSGGKGLVSDNFAIVP